MALLAQKWKTWRRWMNACCFSVSPESASTRAATTPRYLIRNNRFDTGMVPSGQIDRAPRPPTIEITASESKIEGCCKSVLNENEDWVLEIGHRAHGHAPRNSTIPALRKAWATWGSQNGVRALPMVEELPRKKSPMASPATATSRQNQQSSVHKGKGMTKTIMTRTPISLIDAKKERSSATDPRARPMPQSQGPGVDVRAPDDPRAAGPSRRPGSWPGSALRRRCCEAVDVIMMPWPPTRRSKDLRQTHRRLTWQRGRR